MPYKSIVIDEEDYNRFERGRDVQEMAGCKRGSIVACLFLILHDLFKKDSQATITLDETLSAIQDKKARVERGQLQGALHSLERNFERAQRLYGSNLRLERIKPGRLKLAFVDPPIVKKKSSDQERSEDGRKIVTFSLPASEEEKIVGVLELLGARRVKVELTFT